MKTLKRFVSGNVRAVCATVLMLAVLLACVFLPPVVSRLGDQRLLNTEYSQPNDMTVGVYYHEASFLDRLEVFINSRNSAYATSQFVEVKDYQVIYAALRELSPEVAALHEADILPETVSPDLSGKSSYLGVITSIDIRDPFLTIAYRELTTSDLNSDMTCFFRQDVDSGKIIEFWVSGSTTGNPFSELTARSAIQRWAAYLGLERAQVTEASTDRTGGYAILDSGAGTYRLEFGQLDGSAWYSITAQAPEATNSVVEVETNLIANVP